MTNKKPSGMLGLLGLLGLIAIPLVLAKKNSNGAGAEPSQSTATNQINIPRDNAWRSYMTLNHTSKTGKVLVMFSCTAQPGIYEVLEFQISKGGVVIEPTHRTSYLVDSGGEEGKDESVCVQYVDANVGTGTIDWDVEVKSWGVAVADDSFIQHRIFSIIDI